MGWSAPSARQRGKQSKAGPVVLVVQWPGPRSSFSTVVSAGGTGAEQNCSCAAQESAMGGRSDLRAPGTKETANGERHLHKKNTNRTLRAPKALCCAVLYNLYPRGRKQWFSSPGPIHLSRAHISTTAHGTSGEWFLQEHWTVLSSQHTGKSSCSTPLGLGTKASNQKPLPLGASKGKKSTSYVLFVQVKTPIPNPTLL